MTDTDPSELGPPSEHEDRFFMRLDPIVKRLEDKVDNQRLFVQRAFDDFQEKMRNDSAELRSEIAALSGRRNVAPWVVAGSVAALVVSMIAIGIATANRITLEVSRGAPVECVR